MTRVKNGPGEGGTQEGGPGQGAQNLFFFWASPQGSSRAPGVAPKRAGTTQNAAFCTLLCPGGARRSPGFNNLIPGSKTRHFGRAGAFESHPGSTRRPQDKVKKAGLWSVSTPGQEHTWKKWKTKIKRKMWRTNTENKMWKWNGKWKNENEKKNEKKKTCRMKNMKWKTWKWKGKMKNGGRSLGGQLPLPSPKARTGLGFAPSPNWKVRFGFAPSSPSPPPPSPSPPPPWRSGVCFLFFCFFCFFFLREGFVFGEEEWREVGSNKVMWISLFWRSEIRWKYDHTKEIVRAAPAQRRRRVVGALTLSI